MESNSDDHTICSGAESHIVRVVFQTTSNYSLNSGTEIKCRLSYKLSFHLCFILFSI